MKRVIDLFVSNLIPCTLIIISGAVSMVILHNNVTYNAGYLFNGILIVTGIATVCDLLEVDK